MNNTNFPKELKEKLKNGLLNVSNKNNQNLFNYQQNVYNYLTTNDVRGILVYHGVGTGKCHGKNTPILMYDGSLKMVQDIKVGEKLMGDDNLAREVLSTARGTDLMFKIIPQFSKSFIVNESHVLCLKNTYKPTMTKSINGYCVKWLEYGIFHYKYYEPYDQHSAIKFHHNITQYTYNVIVEAELFDYNELSKDVKPYYKLYSNIIEFNNLIDFNINPYIIGYWFGYKHDFSKILNFINNYIGENSVTNFIRNKIKVLYNSIFKHSIKNYILKIYDNIHVYKLNTINEFLNFIYSNDLLYNLNKVPKQYKISSLRCRREFIRGYRDAGSHNYNDDIEYILSSLCLNHNYKSIKEQTFKVQCLKYDKYYGFTLDENNRYVLGNFIVTHNTMTSASIAEHYRNLGRDIMVVAPKSLHQNFRSGLKKFNKNITEKQIDKSYYFVSSNASNMIKQLDTYDKLQIMDADMVTQIDNVSLNNKIVIVDECHTLSNSIVNGSKNGNAFYELVMKAKNIKLLFLTGTPIVNDSFELAPIFNMCKGYLNKYTILPEYYSDYVKYFINEKDNTIKNKDHYQNRIFGLVSYYGEMYKTKFEDFKLQIKKTQKRENFPDLLPINIVKIEMSMEQNMSYHNYRNKEKNEVKRAMGGAINKEKFSTNTSYRIKSRQTSNVLDYDEELSKDNISIISPKMLNVYTKIQKFNNPGIIYSSFLVAGVEYMAKILQLYGYSDYKENNKGKKFALFTGKTPIEERDEILNIFNNKKNKDGELIHILLVSSTGEKGLNLKRVRHVHILEPQWSYTSIEQIIGRAVRYKSHQDLPENEQNVQVFIYISDYNKNFINQDTIKIVEDTTDKTLLIRSIKNKDLNDKFLKLLAETSIECGMFNTGINFNCYTCKDNNKTRYYDNIDVDIKLPNNCVKSFTVEELIVDDETFYYTEDLKIFGYDDSTETYYQVDKETEKYITDKIKLNDLK